LLFALAIPSKAFSEPEKPSPAVSSIPFVGCQSDGQMGLQPAPTGSDKQVHIDATKAAQLAFYSAQQSVGILAPRGWFCFGTYGSGGNSLFITPYPIGSSDFFGKDPKRLAGSGIQITYTFGDTSGRFIVAAIVARVFPDQRGYVDQIIAEKLVPAKDFPVGPYPADKLKRHGPNLVEYWTSPNSKGLGTDSWLKPNKDPIEGFVMLVQPPDLVSLSARLPSNLSHLLPIIMRQAEQEVSKKPPAN
jgi:hypothetical protein